MTKAQILCQHAKDDYSSAVKYKDANPEDFKADLAVQLSRAVLNLVADEFIEELSEE